MRKYFSALSIGMAFLILAILSGCDKDFEEIVDVSTTSYQVTGTSSFSSFRYVVGDSVITIFLSLNSSSNISSVFCDIIASDGKKLNNSPLLLLDNGNPANGDQTAGDNRFTNRFPLSQQNPIGAYRINFYVIDRESTTKLAAVQQFTYDNGQTNVAPVISNLVIPDTIAKGVTFIFSVIANDSNGLSDIRYVLFELNRPDSTVVQNPPGSGNTLIFMDDTGDFERFGDETAGDGIYSFKNFFLDDTSTQTGTWWFEFQALDRGGLYSNKIIHNIVVQ
jgi:hypothetical protein